MTRMLYTASIMNNKPNVPGDRKVWEKIAELLESREMGMPISEADPDFDSTLAYANWYFDNAEKYLSAETTLETETELHQVFYEPLGVAVIIIPWNFSICEDC